MTFKPRLLKQNKSKKDTAYVQLVENLITNVTVRFGDFFLRKPLLRFLGNAVFVTNIT